MKTRTRTASGAQTTDAEVEHGANTARSALADTVRRALAAAASDPSFGERLRRARLALDER